jgi:acyl-CoA thioester hydrolase
MNEFKFYTSIQVRYADLDTQWHVNNTRFLTYIEQARFEYYQHLGLFDGKSFLDLRMIIADVHVSYKAPIYLNQKIRVGTRVSRVGTKSITFESIIEDAETGTACATGEVVGVCFNFRTHESILVPDDWKRKLSVFEGKDF